jgi:hypothetical protein
MKNAVAVALLSAAAAVTAPAARADPDDYVAVPAVEYGEREIELRLGSAGKSGEDRQSAASLALGFGVTPVWFTEIYGKFARAGSSSTHLDAFEWENRFSLTEPGEYWVDLGLLVEIEHPQDRSEGYELRIGPLLQKDFGPVQVNTNFLLQRHYRAQTQEVTELGYQWQIKYRWREALEFGAQGFGAVGKWDGWDPSREQKHTLGPALFGKFPLGNRQALKYDVAYLFKASRAAPDRTLRAQLEYEF